MVFSRVRARALVFSVMLCRSFLDLLAIVFSVLLEFMLSDYPTGMLKLFFFALQTGLALGKNMF